jgi:hypothetical protein
MISRWIIIWKRNVAGKRCRGNQNTFYFQFLFFPQKSCCWWDNVEQCGKARLATDGDIIRRMRVACWITKATETHTHIYKHTHTHTQSYTYCFSTATIVTRTRQDLNAYIRCLSFFFSCVNSACSNIYGVSNIVKNQFVHVCGFDCVGVWEAVSSVVWFGSLARWGFC